MPLSADLRARATAASPAPVDARDAPPSPLDARSAPEAAASLALVTTRDGFLSLESDWNDLFARAGRNTQLFQTFNWLWHWSNHFLSDSEAGTPTLAIVTARLDGRLVLVWPLVAEPIGPLTRLAWMGEPVSQYGDVLIDDHVNALELLGAAWDFAIRETGADLMQLRKVRQDSAIAPVLAERKGATVLSEASAPYLDLASAESFEAYEKRYSSGARRNRKRQRRRLADRGPVTLEWHTGGEAARARVADAFALKHVWLRERGLVSPALADPRTARFFADVARAETHPAGCHVLVLTSSDRPVAIEIGLRCKGRSAIHIIAYDLSYEKTAAGALLMEDSIRLAADQGMTAFDLLAPGDSYKLEWADAAVTVRDWAAPNSRLGRAYAALYLGLLRGAVKRGIDALPLGARRRLAGALSRLGARKL